MSKSRNKGVNLKVVGSKLVGALKTKKRKTQRGV
jgi:hypothetical protein